MGKATRQRAKREEAKAKADFHAEAEREHLKSLGYPVDALVAAATEGTGLDLSADGIDGFTLSVRVVDVAVAEGPELRLTVAIERPDDAEIDTEP